MHCNTTDFHIEEINNKMPVKSLFSRRPPKTRIPIPKLQRLTKELDKI